MNQESSRKPLGELLKIKGLITEEHINFAIQEQKITKEKLGEVLIRLCFVTEYDIGRTLSEQDNVPFVDVDEVYPSQDILKLFNKNLCLTHAFLPFAVQDDHIEVAAANTADQKLGQLISRNTGLKPKFYIAERKKIINTVNKFYYFVEHPVEKQIEKEVNLLVQDTEAARGMENLVQSILHLAVKMRATDVHIRPMKKSTNLSFRIDGVMRSVWSFPPDFSRIITTLKMKADMDIAEQRLPQDGRFSETILNNGYDFRVSTVVSPNGENMVLRILPLESALMGLEQLGFFKKDITTVQQMFNEPFGIILLTGPTGSGKSTTLYAGIRSLDLLEKNVLTVEQPIEYDVPLLRQTQVNEKAGYGFVNAIRYFLRHDPDVILVGEIRDAETASTALRASTTGHLVLSTLHANNAVGAIPRLVDLGVRPFLLADSLIGVVNQRLVRKICNKCKVSYGPSSWEKNYLHDASLDELWKGVGCDMCNGSGYFGRTLVYEILSVTQELSLLINQEAELGVIAKKAYDCGFSDIFSTTVQKIKQGNTTTEEALRVLGQSRYQ